MRSVAIITGAAVLLMSLTGCVPWTVRPIEDADSAKSAAGPAAPAAYVDSIWDSKLLPAILKSATDARTLLDALQASPQEADQEYGHRESGGAAYAAVKGSGRVLAVDTSSRNGLLLVDIAPPDGKADISIQIGPVLRGTALRDATGLIRFTDFANQLQFADVANELNNRVLKTVPGSLDLKTLAGKTVAFTGVFALEEGSNPPIRGVVPVSLTAEASK